MLHLEQLYSCLSANFSAALLDNEVTTKANIRRKLVTAKDHNDMLHRECKKQQPRT